MAVYLSNSLGVSTYRNLANIWLPGCNPGLSLSDPRNQVCKAKGSVGVDLLGERCHYVCGVTLLPEPEQS